MRLVLNPNPAVCHTGNNIHAAGGGLVMRLVLNPNPAVCHTGNNIVLLEEGR